MRGASVAELETVPGISPRDAQAIRGFFDALEAPADVVEEEAEGADEGAAPVQDVSETEGQVGDGEAPAR